VKPFSYWVNGLLIAIIFPSTDYVGSFEVVFVVMTTDNSFETAFALKSTKN
jgi:hypothetical protein